MEIKSLVRPNVLQLKPYSSARDEFSNTSAEMVFLDANENPNATRVNRYPDPNQSKLKQLLAKQKGVSESNILLGNGSDEILDLLFRAFCEPKEDQITVLPPTYGMYSVLAETNAVAINEVPLTTSFEPNVEAILKENRSKLLFLCSPNNPTGNSFSRERILELLNNFKGIVVIDEAYIDFSEVPSWISELNNYPNLVITQTLSKAYGMAGIRLGICYASEETITILKTIKAPYNVNQLTQDYAISVLSEENKVKEDVIQIKKNRIALELALMEFDFIEKIYPSDANFLLVKVDNANKRYEQLISQGVVVRNRSNQLNCTNCLRITVGTTEENKILINKLKAL